MKSSSGRLLDADLPTGNDSQIINKSGMVTYTEIKKATGAFSGLTLQVQTIFKSMERSYSTNGRRKKWTSATLKLKLVKHGWYDLKRCFGKILYRARH